MNRNSLTIVFLACILIPISDILAQQSRSRRSGVPRPLLYAFPENPSTTPLADVRKEMLEKFDIDNLDEQKFETYLETVGIPEPDLLIRTSGERRISNFLLWQCAYSELVFVDTLWPDFEEQDFLLAIKEFSERDRRYGGTIS